MKRFLLIICLISNSVFSFSQQIHTPGEIFKILSNSKLSYEIKMLEKTIECPDYSENLNYHDCYRVLGNSGVTTYKFKVKEQAKPFFDKAEEYFSAKKLDSALVYYKKTLEADTSLYSVMTYIGQIYGTIKDYDNARLWYKRAIAKNYIDYMAHWFLADIYYKTGELDDAVNEIVIAQILNRNNPRIKQQFISVFEAAKRETADWCFNPQIEIKKLSDNKVSVALNDKWTGYALAKAIWMYEPGYRESMGVAEGQHSTVEDRECLVSLLLGLENSKANIKKDLQLKMLKEAYDKKFLNEYILYEIVLPETPFVAYQLSEEIILGIKDYVLKVRNRK